MDRQVEFFIDKFVQELTEENAAIFAGAGLSIAAGFVDWKALLSPIAQQLGLNVDKEHDLVSLAQYHCNHYGNRHELNQRLIDEFCSGHVITENHRILARLPIRIFWTTNYDRLIEKALEDARRIPDAKYTVKQLAYTKAKRDAIVYKMHGDVEHPDEAVLTKDDYEKYYLERGPFVTALSGDLVSKTFLFIGFSFTDPNLDYILSRVRINFPNDLRNHYCIIKKREQRLPTETEEEYNYAVLKQELMIKDLQRFHIQTILVESYDEITTILRAIESRYRHKTVLISGSAHEYGEFQEAEAFIQDLSRALIQNGYKIVSGFGLGVGSHVITGALQQIYEKQGKQLHDQLVLRPFPQGGEDIQRQWETYRQDMVSYAGVAIFIFGNKLNPSGDGVMLANGVKREFDIANDKGLKLIPIGATGFITKELWQNVIDNFESYYPDNNAELKKLFLSLNESASSSTLIDIVIKILNQLKGT